MKVKTKVRAGSFAISDPALAAIVLQDGTHGCDVCQTTHYP